MIGQELAPISVICDNRWLMAYAAGVPDESPELFDTLRGVVAHPLFPVAPEWALLVAHRSEASPMSREEVARGLHVAHDLVHDRRIIPGETIHIGGRIVGVGRRRAGATQCTLFEARDSTGRTVWRTSFSTLFPGVELEGQPAEDDFQWPEMPKHPAESAGLADSGRPIAHRTSNVRSVDAHVYSECARIWNPIHTDAAVARANGLDAPVLHGTATLARAVSIVAELMSIRLADIVRVGGTFSAAVPLASTITIRVLSASCGVIAFDVVNDASRRCLTDGVVVAHPHVIA